MSYVVMGVLAFVGLLWGIETAIGQWVRWMTSRPVRG